MRALQSSATLALCLLLAQSAQSWQGDTLEYVFPTEVVISAPRMNIPLREVPFSASVVDSLTMSSMPRSIAVDEPLKLVPGVKVDNQANGARIHLSIRGQGILTERGIRGIRVLFDGIPVNDPTGFAPDFYDVDFSTVDRIEVLRGAAASLYGGSSSAGIVNIVSRNSPAVPLYGSAGFTAGSNAFWKGFGEFGGNVDKVNYRVSASRMMGDGYRVHTHFSGDNLYAKAVYTPSASIVVTPIFGWTKVYHENPEGINLVQYNTDPTQANPDAVPFNEYLQTERTTNGLAGTILIDNKQQVDVVGYVKRTDFTEANNRTFNYRTLTSPGASAEYSLHSGATDAPLGNRLSFGTDMQWQTIEEHRVDNLHAASGDTLRSMEETRQRGIGFFVIDKINIGTPWGVTLSLRYDKIQNELTDLFALPYDLSGKADFEKVTGHIGATYSPTNDLNFFVNWGQGFLPPATEELAQNPDNFGGFNSHLVPATSSGTDVGVRGSLAGSLYYDATLFYLATDNDFDRYRISNPLRNQETFYRNASSSRRTGFELYCRYAPIGAWNIQLAYTFSHFVYSLSTPIRVIMDDTTIIKYIRDGNKLPNSPDHQLTADVEYQVTRTLLAGIGLEYLSKTYIDGANVEAEAASAYALLHARLQYVLNFAGYACDLQFQCRNLTNTKFAAFTEPDPGGNSYQPGAGREVFVGLKIRL